MEQNNLFGSDSTEWNQSETTQKLSDSMPSNVETTTQKKLPNAHWDSIGTFRDSPTDICIARTLLSIPRTVLNLVMGRKNLE